MKGGQLPLSLIVPADVIRLTSEFFTALTGVEACCFWLGLRGEEKGVVEGVVVPPQKNMPGNYHVTADAMLRVAQVARGKGWKNLAQIHSHPGPDVHHSGYDDEMANSRRALSLVYPHYGRLPGMWRFRGWIWRLWPGPFPAAVGVHAFLRDRWLFLNAPDRGRAINVIAGPKPEFIDLRT